MKQSVSTSGVVASDGVRLEVHERGNPAAPTVLCVHGFPDDHRVWDGVAAELESSFHVVTFDVRGSGRSGAPREIRDYRLDQLGDDIRTVIDAVAPDRQVHLLGHDWGSVQAWHVATEPRDRRIASLTSISGPCIDHLPFWLGERMSAGPQGWRDALKMWKSPIYMSLLMVPGLAPLACRIGVVDGVIEWAGRYEATERPPQLPRHRARANRAALKIYSANLWPRVMRPQRRHAEVPVQVLAPRRDVFVASVTQTRIGRWAANRQVRSISGGHWAPAFTPAVIAEHVRTFVDGHATTEGATS